MMKKYTFDAKNGLWYEQCGEYQQIGRAHV